MIKVRTQIYLDSDDMKELSREGKRHRCSLSQVIRVAIKDYLRKKKIKVDWEKEPLTKLVGKFSTDVSDGSINHDKYIYGV